MLFFASCNKNQLLEELDHDITVIQITINEDYLWSPDSGLFVIGNNGIALGSCNTIANYNQNWEFPAELTLSKKGQITDIEKVGFKIKGNCTRANAMKSIGIYWRKEYGKKNTDYPFFGDESADNYKRLFLRNSGNDFGITHIKDAAITQIIKDFTAAETQNYKPSAVYLNNDYWGIYNMRDMITPHHFKYTYNVNEEYVDILEGNEQSPTADDGSTNLFLDEVVNFVQNNDLEDDKNFEKLSEQINVESYMDYIITQTYIANGDQLENNVKWWRDRTTYKFRKWTWIIYDTDLGFNLNKVNEFWLGDLAGDNRSGFFLFNHMIKNEKFRDEFLERYTYFLDHVFEKERVKYIIKKLMKNIDYEYTNHQKKWNTISKYNWNKKVNQLIQFNNERNDFIQEKINNLIDDED